MYLRTTEAIADYVGTEYGKAMRMLVKYGEGKDFTEPDPPTAEAVKAPGLLEKYRTDLTIYRKEQREYEEQKAKVFVVLLNQCSPDVKARLRNDTGLKTLEINDDVVGLLKALRKMAFTMEGIQHPNEALFDVLKRLLVINQGPKEQVSNYYKRFLALTEVVEAQWGDFVPTKVANKRNVTTAQKNAAREGVLAHIFLAGANNEKYELLKTQLHNSYLGKKDDYPATVEAAVLLLSHYQGPTSGRRERDDNFEGATSFAQAKVKKNRFAKARCYLCNEVGHIKPHCPLNKKQYSQVDSDDKESSGKSKGGGVGWSG